MKLNPLLLMMLNLLLIWGVWATVQSESGSDFSQQVSEEILEEIFEEECLLESLCDVVLPVLRCELGEVDVLRFNELDCSMIHCVRGFIFGWRVPLRI